MENVNISQNLRSTRIDYTKNSLLESSVQTDPLLQFKNWMQIALENDPAHANAMILSTVDSKLVPDSRVMLLRNISYGGFTFFTNYTSKKALDLAKNDNAAMLFFWPESQRQVRISGRILQLPGVESDEYFASRPFESQVGAWASRQSDVVENREALDERFNSYLKKFEGQTVPRPENWGGYVLVPHKVEFWQGRQNRLHDRIRYILNPSSNSWKIERLMP